MFESQATWNPLDSTREFSVYGSDYGFATIGTVVSRLAAERAPGVRFRFMLHNPSIVDEVSTRLRAVDGMMIPHGYLTDLPYVDLWRDGWVIVASESNEAIGDELTMDLLGQLPWVFTYQSRTAFTSAARQLQQLGIEPRVEVIVESFLSLPHFITGTNRLGLLQAGLHRSPHSRCPASGSSRRRSMPHPSSTRCGGIRSTTATPSTRGCAALFEVAARVVDTQLHPAGSQTA